MSSETNNPKDKIIVYENKSSIITFGVSVFLLALIIILIGMNEDWISPIAVGIIILIALIIIIFSILICRNRYLEISQYQCVYQNLFSFRKEFVLSDIAIIRTERPFYNITGVFKIINHNGEVLASVEKNMINAKEALHFLEDFLNSHSENPENSSEDVMDTLVVRPKKRPFSHTLLFVFCVCIEFRYNNY